MSNRLARLLHPAFLLALAVLLLNDHVLKDAFSSPITGKLSDIAGLVVLPVLLTALLRIQNRQLVWMVHLAVGLAFAALQFVPESTLWAVGLPVQHTPDPTDLVALAILPLGVRLSLAEPRQLGWMRPALANAVGLVAVGAVLATSPPRAPLVVDKTPVVAAETPREALRQLEGRLDTLGFEARGSAVLPYDAWIDRQGEMPDDDEARALHQQIMDNVERRLAEGEEYYSVRLPAGGCPEAPAGVSLVLDLETRWDSTSSELVVRIPVIDFGAGDWQFADDDVRGEGRRLAERCVIDPLLGRAR
ncbi:MAG: hypothetical protein Rubg2KO_04650 [Rubricoccaceae bacterium]